MLIVDEELLIFFALSTALRCAQTEVQALEPIRMRSEKSCTIVSKKGGFRGFLKVLGCVPLNSKISNFMEEV